MRIGELADLAGVTVRTIRYYHKKGVLAEPERRGNGYGEYTVDDLVVLVRIRQLTSSGLSLEHAGAVVADPNALTERTLDEIDAALGRRIATLTTQRERLAASRAAGRIGLSKLAAALTTTPSDIPISSLFAHLYGDDLQADVLAETLQRPEIRTRMTSAQTRFESLDENTTSAELTDLAAHFESMVAEVFGQVPTVEDHKTRLLLSLVERDLNNRQLEFMRLLA